MARRAGSALRDRRSIAGLRAVPQEIRRSEESSLKKRRSLYSVRSSLCAGHCAVFRPQLTMFRLLSAVFCRQLSMFGSTRAMFQRQLTMCGPPRAVFGRQLIMCGPPRAVFNHQLTTFGDRALYSVIRATIHGHRRRLHVFFPMHRPLSRRERSTGHGRDEA
jgi:hypothetical protein